MKKYLKALQKCTLFNQISEKDLTSLLCCLGAKFETFDKKYTIFTEGNPAKYIGIILSGSAKIIQTDYFGNRNIVANVEQSEIFGESFACAESSSFPITVVANEPCEVMLIESQRIMHTCINSCSFHNQIIYNLMKDIAYKNVLFYQKIEITSKRTTREKLLTYLMFYSKKEKSDSFYIPFDRQELADFLEVERSGLSAEISRLRNENIIESRKNYFKLL